jgi:hypothetical protein
MTSVVESEAQTVRWLAQGVLAGRSLKSLAAELNEQGKLTALGTPWRSSNLGKFLANGAYLTGQRVYHGEIVGPATWPAVLDADVWQACRTLLLDPSRRTSVSQARRYLLTGIARCSLGCKLRGRNNGANTTAASYWCNHVTRRADLVDATVRAHIVARLAQVDMAGVLAGPAEDQDTAAQLTAQIAQVEARLNDLADRVVMGEINASMLASATRRANQEVDAMRAQLADLAVTANQPSAVLDGLAGMPNAAELFDALDLDRRRAVVDCLAKVTVRKATRKGAAFDPALVDVSWK